MPFVEPGNGGGRAAGRIGGALGGSGGAAGGSGAEDDGGARDVNDEEGLRPVGGGTGGFLPIGGAGLGFEDRSGEDAIANGDGRKLLFTEPGMSGVEPVGRGVGGGLGAEPMGRGMEGRRDDSGSEEYEASSLAPVAIPPLFLSFGIPPAKSPPSCGAALDVESTAGRETSLLLRALFAAVAGTPSPPGTGGAPSDGLVAELDSFPTTIGADLSFVVAFFSFRPC